jgi:hypothetical protein
MGCTPGGCAIAGKGTGNSNTSASETNAATTARRRAFTKPHTGRIVTTHQTTSASSIDGRAGYVLRFT